MNPFKKLKLPGEIDVIKEYVIVDAQGKIFAHTFKNPENVAKMVSKCGESFKSAGKRSLQYLYFSTPDDTFFIFPIGNYYFGVIKQKNISTADFVKSMMQFFKELS